MSNVDIDFDKLDYSVGNLTMEALYNDRSVVSATWDDFLKLPKVAGYQNNERRVPNDFSTGVRDKKDDPLNTTDEPMVIIETVNNVAKE